MNLRRALSIAALLIAGASGAAAQSDLTEATQEAAAQLEAAADALKRADRARDRIGALSQTIRAYENGLSALRASLRQLAVQDQAMTDDLTRDRDQLSKLLAALQSLGSAPSEAMLLHPSGALATTRAGILMGAVAPALEGEVRSLADRLEHLRALRSAQDLAADELEAGLAGVQEARAALTQAMSDRSDLPIRFTVDAAALRRLLDSAKSLNEFADGLQRVTQASNLPAAPGFADVRGQLSPPVAGTLLRRFNEEDAAGIKRPGLILATRPRALVSAPWPATLRYRGPLLDYGQVVILEPGEGYLMVLAGLSEVYGEIGEIVPQGAPVGLMGGETPQVEAILGEAQDAGSRQLTETLYIELRENGMPVDPGPWFAEN